MAARSIAVFSLLVCSLVSAQLHQSRGFTRPRTRVQAQTYSQEPSGYGENSAWPASLVIDTSNTTVSADVAAQHDQFYGGGGGRSFSEEERPRVTTVEERRTATVEERQPASTSTRRPSTSTTPTPRPEFTPNERRPTTVVAELNDYEGRRLPLVAAARDRDSQRRPTTTASPYENEDDARFVTKLLNIDNRSRFTADAGDAKPEAYETNGRFTRLLSNRSLIADRVPVLLSRDRNEQPASPFVNDTSAEEEENETNRTAEINEILSRRLNTSKDEPLEDENLQRATLNIARLLHDEAAAVAERKAAEGSMKVGKKVRVIRLPPMPVDADSEEIIVVGDRGNVTIKRGRSMYIQAASVSNRH
ncbi:hypothetical protein M3Y99_01780100 [Aphelenchoides fujianensis]|nr:hypothetical protein M3Y99_01780100 [Aphelenchoides fujianensis]